MSKETILTFVGASCSDIAIKNVIEMAENSDEHLSIVIIAAAPALYSYGYGSAYGGYADVHHWTQKVKELGDALDQRSEHIEKLVQAAHISAEILKEYCEVATMGPALSRYANVADRVVLLEGGGVDSDVEDAIISSVIFGSPIGLIKGKDSHLAASNPKHILIAWDSTKHAAAAVQNALPLLDKAEQVTIAIFDPVNHENADGEEPGADLASRLSRRGCKVTVEQYPSGGDEIATCILKRAAEKGADLVVMGGYGHMKLRQQVFGGTTQTMLKQSKVPVFIAHK